MTTYKRPPKRKNQKPINVIVHYPTTEEGKRELNESYSSVVFDILEKKLGSEGLDKLMKLYEEKKGDK
jgi:hypothetical protein